MQIKAFKYAQDIPESYLPSLIDAQIECWGAAPFDEYKICTNPDCWAIYSIQDVHESIDKYKKADWDVFCCTECEQHAPTQLMYTKEQFLETVREYISQEVSAVLLLNNEKQVEWFWVTTRTTVGDLVEQEFSTRPMSYAKDELIKNISWKLFASRDASKEEIILFHQVYVSELIRKWNISMEILRKLFSLNKEHAHIPVIWETRYDSRFYPISRSIWFKDIQSDAHGYVVQWIWTYQQILDYFFHERNNNKESVATLRKYRKHALWVLNEQSKLTSRKFYIYN